MSITSSSRRRLVVGSATVIGVLAVASAAFACTSLRGQLTVSGSGTSSSTTVGDVSKAHAFCSIGGGAKASSGGAVSLTVAPASTCLVNGENKLHASHDWVGGIADGFDKGVGPYKVFFTNLAVFDRNPGGGPNVTYTYPDVNQCIGDGVVGTELTGTFLVDSAGNGAWSGTLPAGLTNNGPSDSSGICVRNSGRNNFATLAGQLFGPIDAQVNMAPINIV